MKKNKYLTIAIIAIIAIIGLILIANYQNIFKAVMPPKPIVVSSKADGSSSKLFEYSVRVSGSIRNDGGNGYVVVKATVNQGEKSWEKTKQLYFESYQTQNFTIDFDEVKLFDSDPNYSVTAHALGSLNE